MILIHHRLHFLFMIRFKAFNILYVTSDHGTIIKCLIIYTWTRLVTNFDYNSTIVYTKKFWFFPLRLSSSNKDSKLWFIFLLWFQFCISYNWFFLLTWSQTMRLQKWIRDKNANMEMVKSKAMSWVFLYLLTLAVN